MKLYIEAFEDIELQKVHSATLEVLDKTGVKVESEETRDLLKQNGARVDGGVVSFPANVTEKAISQINKKVTLAARDPKKSLHIPSNITYNSTSGYAAFTYDWETGKSRLSTSKDLAEYAILSDAIDEIDMFWPIVMPTEIEPEGLQEITALDISFRNITKHVQCSISDGEAAKFQIKLASALAGGEDKLRENPLFSVVASPFTPLMFKKGVCEAYLHMARAGVPVTPMNVPLAGSTAPGTMAGAIVMTNAEQIATLLILKAANKDAPMVYSSDTGTANMTSGGLNYDSPDRPVLCAAMSQLARYYGFPTCTSHDSSEEKGYENKGNFMLNALRIAMNMMTHSDLAIWMGSMDESLGASLWDLYLDVEAVKRAKEFNRTFDIDDESLAVHVINEVGIGGHYLSHDHTLENFRDNISLYNLDKTFIYNDDNPDYYAKAKKIVRDILSTHKVVQIPDDKLNAMDEIMTEAGIAFSK